MSNLLEATLNVEEPREGLIYIARIVGTKGLRGDTNKEVVTVEYPDALWTTIVGRGRYKLDELVCCFLPDTVLVVDWLRTDGYRVVPKRVNGAINEVRIGRLEEDDTYKYGEDITRDCGVSKYRKFLPRHIEGKLMGRYPLEIPRTGEKHYQESCSKIIKLMNKPYYMTEKMDGLSVTAYKMRGKYGMCTNYSEVHECECAVWEISSFYGLPSKISEGLAVQFEVCGPEINGNNACFDGFEARVFDIYDIAEKRYYLLDELRDWCDRASIPMVKILEEGNKFIPTKIYERAEGKYEGGNDREGVVIRGLELQECGAFRKPISFKFLNLNYKH